MGVPTTDPGPVDAAGPGKAKAGKSKAEKSKAAAPTATEPAAAPNGNGKGDSIIELAILGEAAKADAPPVAALVAAKTGEGVGQASRTDGPVVALTPYDTLLNDLIKFAATEKGNRAAGIKMSRLILIVRKLRQNKADDWLYEQARLTFSYISSPAGWGGVDRLLQDLEFKASSNSPIYVVLRGMVSSLIWIFAVAVVAFAFHTLTVINDMPWVGLLGLPVAVVRAFQIVMDAPFVLGIIFGLLGAVVSILLRISEFEGSTRTREFLRTTGIILPFIGMIFAVVACAIFATGLLTLQVGEQRLGNASFFIVLGFISGFSERFMRGLLGRFQNTILTPSGTNTTEQTTSTATVSETTTRQSG